MDAESRPDRDRRDGIPQQPGPTPRSWRWRPSVRTWRSGCAMASRRTCPAIIARRDAIRAWRSGHPGACFRGLADARVGGAAGTKGFQFGPVIAWLAGISAVGLVLLFRDAVARSPRGARCRRRATPRSGDVAATSRDSDEGAGGSARNRSQALSTNPSSTWSGGAVRSTTTSRCESAPAVVEALRQHPGRLRTRPSLDFGPWVNHSSAFPVRPRSPLAWSAPRAVP